MCLSHEPSRVITRTQFPTGYYFSNHSLGGLREFDEMRDQTEHRFPMTGRSSRPVRANCRTVATAVVFQGKGPLVSPRIVPIARYLIFLGYGHVPTPPKRTEKKCSQVEYLCFSLGPYLKALGERDRGLSRERASR